MTVVLLTALFAFGGLALGKLITRLGRSRTK